MLMKLLLLGGLCALPVLLGAQHHLSDDFSAPLLGGQPVWMGDTTRFTITADSQLRLQAPPATGDAWLYAAAPTRLGDSSVWELAIRMDFAPSDNNRFLFWLAGTAADPLSGRGYFLKIGETGAQDALRLYRQDGPGQTVELASGASAAVANMPRLRVRVTRNPSGIWQIWADYSGGGAFQPEGVAVRDTVWAHAGYSGLWCRYTASNAEKFYFDDFSVGPLWADSLPPQLIGSALGGDSVVWLTFDEPLEETSAEYAGNYAFFPPLPIEGIVLGPDRPDRVRIDLAENLLPGLEYRLRIEGLRDVAGNETVENWALLRYDPPVLPARHELIFTEIYPDPVPGFGLPGYEFVELYHRGTVPLPLGGLRLVDRSGGQAVLPNDTLWPGTWVLLCPENAAAAFSGYGKTIGLEGFPTLNDDGDTLLLFGSDGVLLDAVGYDRSTYGDPVKSSGGWTLTRLDWDRPCLLRDNWSASEAVYLGGTPGGGSSRPIPGGVRPLLGEHLWPLDATHLDVRFSRSLDPVAAADPENYRLSGGLAVVGAQVLPPLYDRVVLALDGPLVPGIVHILYLSPALRDCQGDTLAGPDSFRVALPLSPLPGEVVVHEILFDPLPYGSDFVELYNRSSKPIHLGDLVLADADGNGFPSEKIRLPEGTILFPGEYRALTPDTAFLAARYPCTDRGALIETELPAMPDDSGRILLLGLTDDGSAQLLETARYHADMHAGLLSATEGISLERRDPARGAEEPYQWFSAGSGCGHATPGRANSVGPMMEGPSPGTWIELVEPAFAPSSPGGSGTLTIRYDVGATSGMELNVRVYDAQGRWVGELCQGLFVQGSGALFWDGTQADGSPAPPGAYIFRAEAIGAQGEGWRKKLVGVLVGE